jgi:hypothetical protein
MATTKEDVAHLERAEDTTPGVLPNTSGENLDDDLVYTRTEQRKIIHRVDRRLITIAGIIYMNSLMDRSNLPNAGIAGMNLDLEMINMRYVCVDTKRKFLSALALTIYSVHRRPSLLRHIHDLPASSNASDTEDRPKALPFIHLPRLGRDNGRICLRHEMVGAHPFAPRTRSPGSRLFPRSRLSNLNLVLKIRHGEKIRLLLRARISSFRLFWHPGIRSPTTVRRSGSGRLEVDFPCFRSDDYRRRFFGLRFPGRLPRSRAAQEVLRVHKPRRNRFHHPAH